MENNVRGEMKEMKERLDTLMASLEEDKDQGQFYERPAKINTSLQSPESLHYHMSRCENFYSVIWRTCALFCQASHRTNFSVSRSFKVVLRRKK